MGKQKIVFYGPTYVSSSYGIKCMFFLAKVLIKAGWNCHYIVNSNVTKITNQPYISRNRMHYEHLGEKLNISDNDICVYTDTIIGNPLNAKKIVRWLCNKPYVLTGQGIDYAPDEVVVSYSTLINSTIEQLFILIDERDVFDEIKSNINKTGKTVAVYFGKVHENVINRNVRLLSDILNDFDNVKIITRLYPNNHKKTLTEVANSDLLITFDPLSNLNYEATLLGVPTLFMDDTFNIQNTVFNVNNSGFFFKYEDFENTVKCIDTVYNEYSLFLDRQEEILKATFENIIVKLNQISENEEVFEKNKRFNNSLKKTDIIQYRKINRKPFKNIDFPFQIPTNMKKILRTYVTIDGEKDKFSSLLNNPTLIPGTLKMSELFLLLTRKPQWDKEFNRHVMYYKKIEDLKANELLFLIVRRIKVGTMAFLRLKS